MALEVVFSVTVATLVHSGPDSVVGNATLGEQEFLLTPAAVVEQNILPKQ